VPTKGDFLSAKMLVDYGRFCESVTGNSSKVVPLFGFGFQWYKHFSKINVSR